MARAPTIQARAEAELERRRRSPGRDLTERPGEASAFDAARAVLPFRDFIARVNPRYRFYRHAEQLISVLQRVADGDVRRLMVFMPPRHGKSELVSRLLPAYYLYRHPERFVGLASYGADLSYGFSRNARANFEEAGGQMAGDASAVKYWATAEGGGMWAAGVGGPITGRGYHLGIVDDPLKDAEQALSDKVRGKQKDWWDSTWATREEPRGAQIVMLTRWHEDDLAGWLLEREAREGLDEDGDPDRWHVACMEAIRTGEPPAFPETCTLEPDVRRVGEALCPERVPLRKLQRAKKRSSYWFSALFQQRPSPDEGGLWKRAWFEGEGAAFDQEPEGLLAVGYDFDTAHTADEKNAACAYVKTGRDADGTIYVLDLDWRWIEFPEQVAWMKALRGPHYIEAKSTGKSAKQSLDRQGVIAVEVPVTGGDKVARATLATPVAEAGRIRVRRSLLGRLLDDDKQGILKFPNSTHADLCDALVQAIARHGAVSAFEVWDDL